MKRFLSLTTIVLIALLSVFSLGFANEVKQEELKAVEALVDVLSGKIGGYSAQIQEMRESFQEIDDNVSALGEKIGGLENQDKFLWQKIEILNKNVKSLESNGINEKVTEIQNMVNSIQEDLSTFVNSEYVDEKVWGISQRIKWLETAISNLKKRLEENDVSAAGEKASIETSLGIVNSQLLVLQAGLDSYKETQGKFDQEIIKISNDVQAMKEELDKLNEDDENVDKRIKALADNDTFLWKKITNLENQLKNVNLEEIDREINELTTIVSGTVEDIASMVSRKDFEEKVSGINQRMKWMDALLNKLKKGIESVESSSSVVDLESVEKRISELETLTDTLNSLVEGNYEKLTEMLSSSVSLSNGRYGELKATLEEVNGLYTTLKQEVESNEKLDEDNFSSLSEKLNDAIAESNGRYGELKATLEEVNGLYTALKQEVESNEKLDEDNFSSLNEKLNSAIAESNGLYDELKATLKEVNGLYTTLKREVENNEKLDEDNFSSLNEKLSAAIAESNGKYEELGNRLWEINEKIDTAIVELKASDESIKNTVDGNMNYLMGMVNDSEERMKAVADGNKSILENSINSSAEALKASIRENIDVVKELIQEDVASINKRLRWMEVGLNNIKERLALNEEKVLEIEKTFNEKIDANMLSINEKLNNTSDYFEAKVVALQTSVEDLNISLNATINEKVWALNKRLRWVDTQLKVLKENKAEVLAVENLGMELDEITVRVSDIEVQDVFYSQITDTILVNLAKLQKQTDILEAKVEKISIEYATKEMVENQIVALDGRINDLQDTLNQKIDTNDRKIRAAVWEINQRLEWIDKAIIRIGEEQKIQDSERKELERLLNEKIDSKVAAINQRLRWVDKGISSLKINKVDVAVYEKTIDGIQKSKVDNTVFMDTVAELKDEMMGLDSRIDILENTTVRKTVFNDFANSTKLSIEKNRMELDAKIMSDRERITSNEDSIEDHENRIQSLESRVDNLEKGMNTVAQAVNGCLMVGLGIAVLGLILVNK